jgi:hypothetical protein
LQKRRSVLLEHFIGTAEQRERHLDAKRFGYLEIDNQFDFRRFLNRQFGRLLALENPPGIDADQPVIFGFIAAIAQQPAAGGKLRP